MLLAQVAAWDVLLAGNVVGSRVISLTKTHGISIPRTSQDSLRGGHDYKIIRDHFLNASSQERSRVGAFACCCGRWPVPLTTWCCRAHIHQGDVTDVLSLAGFLQQERSLQAIFRGVIRNLNGGVSITAKWLTSHISAMLRLSEAEQVS